MLLNDSITPQFFKPVKTSCFPKENMNHYIYIVEQYPFLIFDAFHVPRFLAQFFRCFFFNACRNRFHLRGGVGIANHKKVTYCIANVAKVNRGDVLTFFTPYCINDDFDFRKKRWLLPG